MPLRQPGCHQQVHFARAQARKNLSVAALHDLGRVAEPLKNLAHDGTNDGVEGQGDLPEHDFAVALVGAAGSADALQ